MAAWAVRLHKRLRTLHHQLLRSVFDLWTESVQIKVIEHGEPTPSQRWGHV